MLQVPLSYKPTVAYVIFFVLLIKFTFNPHFRIGISVFLPENNLKYSLLTILSLMKSDSSSSTIPIYLLSQNKAISRLIAIGLCYGKYISS